MPHEILCNIAYMIYFVLILEGLSITMLTSGNHVSYNSLEAVFHWNFRNTVADSITNQQISKAGVVGVCLVMFSKFQLKFDF